jgi:HK97 family phage prohead protease
MNETRVYRQVGAPELRVSGDTRTITGYAAVFDRLSQNLGGFVEEVDPGAFTETLQRKERNITALANHNVDWLLGTTLSGTLRLSVDGTGLPYEVDLDMTDPDAQRIAAKVAKRKMLGSSFSFRAIEDAWSTTDQGFPLRRLLAVELFDVGPVTNPAYLDTQADGMSVALRSLSTFIDRPFDQVVDAARSNTLKDLISRDLGNDAEDPPDVPSSGETSEGAATRGRRNPPSSAPN